MSIKKLNLKQNGFVMDHAGELKIDCEIYGISKDEIITSFEKLDDSLLKGEDRLASIVDKYENQYLIQLPGKIEFGTLVLHFKRSLIVGSDI